MDRFAELLRKGIDTWRTAGQVLVEMARTTPDIIKRITERHPHISASTLETFMRIGRNEIWPPLLADSSYGARRLMECNYDLQKEYAQKPIEIAVEWRNDKIRTTTKKVSDLSRSEAAIVFNGNGGINNVEQQAFRLPRSSCGTSKPVETIVPIEAPVVRRKNVDIGYFKMVIKDGLVTCEPCERSTTAQPVRVVGDSRTGMMATVVFYRQENA